jgi:hypothetical protein
MKLLFICLLLCLLIISPISIAAMPETFHPALASMDGVNSLEAENRLLESELKLAKKPQIYFIFDLKTRTIFLKSRGITFKELRIKNIEFWGYPVDTSPHTLIKRSTLFEPDREKIKPKKPQDKETKKTEKFEIEALELEDMPTSYRLTLNESIVISVRSKSSGVISTLSNTIHRINWYLSGPILTLWNYLREKPFTAIYITLGKEDARSLYWHFYEGTESVIYNPS